MLNRCPRCTRANPPEAVFCFADGAALGSADQHRAIADPARQRFPRPFVFPSGQACHSFDELVLACFNEWHQAGELLRDGAFASFLAGMGRADLSRTARDAARQPDVDRALDSLVSRLPSSVLQPPKLSVDSAVINLGEIRPGTDIRLNVRLENRGLGLLTGSADCSAVPWLFLGEPGTASKRKLFQFLQDGQLPFFIQGRSILASRRPFEGMIVLESNAGSFSLPVRFNISILPFAEGALTGCTSPRQVADRALAQPREAGELFASGAVARWYASNGWSYPVKEPAATGVAAVQQFFEALGLTKPPKVVLDRDEIHLESLAGEAVSASVELTTDEKRPVWAHVECSAPWLDVREVVLDRRGATVRLGATKVPDSPGEDLKARVSITTNGRQKFAVVVRLAVKGRKPEVVVAPPPVLPRLREDAIAAVPAVRIVAPEPAPPPPKGGRGRLVLATMPVLLILLGLSVTLGRDIGSWLRNKGGPDLPGMANFVGRRQRVWLGFHDYPKLEQMDTGGGPRRSVVWEPSMRFGLFMAQKEGKDRYRRLTYEEEGITNNCVVRLDGQELIVGERPFRDRTTGAPLGNWPGKWQDRDAKLDRPLKEGRKSVWLYEEQKVTVTQTVGLVVGEQSGQIDTCLVHYRIDNGDSRPHRVGLRFLLDTFIGANDGVPFLIPGQASLCSTMAEFPRRDAVPDFIQACERENLANPGTIAQLQLRLPGLEAPSRVTLGAWPNAQLGGRALQEKTLWEVPVLPIKSIIRDGQGDSAVAMYWEEKDLPAGGSREVGFAYGLGSVSSGDASGQLALTAGGAFVPGGEFTLTAYVNNPARGQTVTVALPEGFALIEGQPTAPVPPPPADGSSKISPVTWRVRAGRETGKFTLKAASSTGPKQSHMVEIKVRGLFGN